MSLLLGLFFSVLGLVLFILSLIIKELRLFLLHWILIPVLAASSSLIEPVPILFIILTLKVVVPGSWFEWDPFLEVILFLALQLLIAFLQHFDLLFQILDVRELLLIAVGHLSPVSVSLVDDLFVLGEVVIA